MPKNKKYTIITDKESHYYVHKIAAAYCPSNVVIDIPTEDNKYRSISFEVDKKMNKECKRDLEILKNKGFDIKISVE